MMHSNEQGGMIVGLIMGFLHSIHLLFQHLQSNTVVVVFAQITWYNLFETVVLTFVGGICGFAGQWCMKWAKKKIE